MDISDQLQAQVALTPEVCKSRLSICKDSISTNKCPILHIAYFSINPYPANVENTVSSC
jgi:hypothetical protein